MMGKVFTHAGDIGDIIYSLPAIRAQGGGKLVLFDMPGRTAHGMTRAKAERIRPLLELQPYIDAVEFSETLLDSDLNGFRDHWRAGVLTDMHLATQGKPWQHRRLKWISVDEAKQECEVAVHWTPRYQNSRFPWKAMLSEYGDRAAFVGLKHEHEKFEAKYGKIRLLPIFDFLHLAQVIAGSKLFVGNQSSPLAIAHAMKHPTVMCIAPGDNQQHCVFQRINCIIGWDEKIEWPVL